MDAYVIYTSRIGHLAMNTELFLRRKSIGLQGVTFRLVDHFSGNFIANNQLFKMIKRKLDVRDITLYDYSNLIKKGYIDKGIMSSMSNEVWEFNNIKPQLEFHPYEIEKGKKLLKKLGINDNPYVCIHSRDKKYLNTKFPNYDYSYHDYRDCSIKNYMKAADWLTENGIFVIRVGEDVTEDLNTKNKMIIDYSKLYRSDFGDIFLPAHCEFFLGNTAGFWLIPTIFGRNVAMANTVPFNILPLLKDDIYIPKNSNFSFQEQLNIDISQFEKSNFELVENNEDEIFELAKEMFNKVYKKNTIIEYNKIVRREKFRSLWSPKMRSFGYVCNIADFYLEKNECLL